MSGERENTPWPRRPGDRVVRRPGQPADGERPARSGPGFKISPPRFRSGAQPVEEEAPSRSFMRRPGDRVVRLVKARDTRLRRVLGVTGLFSTGYGNVGSSIYYALGVTALFALGAAPLALTIAGIFFILTVLTYTEATVALPEAGGASSFARHGLNEFASFFAGWATLLSYTVTIAISAYAAGGYLSVFFPILREAPYTVIFAVGAIVLLMVLNVVGIQEAASFSVVFAAIDLLTQIVLVIVGGIFLLNVPQLIGQVHFGVAPTWSNFIYGISLAMVAYTGIETISNMSGEARMPARSVPRSYGGLIFAVLVLFAGISTVALSAMPVVQVDGQYTTELATTYINDPVAGIAHKLPEPFSMVLTPMVGFLASSILLIGANAGIIGVSRLSFSMGAHRQIPGFWYQVHPRFHTPYVAIIFFCLVALFLVVMGNLTQMSEAYVFAAMLTFAMAHASTIGMRIRRPDLPRPFKLPWNWRVRGWEIPLTAVIGGLGCLAVWLMIVANYPFGRAVGLSWVMVGIALYVIYRRRSGLPIFASAGEPAQREWGVPRPPAEPPVAHTAPPGAPVAQAGGSTRRWPWRRPRGRGEVPPTAG